MRPDYAYDFDLDVSAGDILTFTVTATSSTGGTAVIENQTTGNTVTQDFSNESDGALCQTNAEWIVEDVSIAKPEPSSRDEIY